ncbi:MAG: twin-arginine translocation signal domain-containing protein [Gemmatimonadota bacterium]|nr:MAG: twin-arginine translocation signal domain-containing protein [Gemmatimonadota bacterium]
MYTDTPIPPCAQCALNRREFLKTSGAACAGAFGTMLLPAALPLRPSDDPPRIRILYALHGEQQEVPDWPNVGFDFRPVMEQFTTHLATQCQGFEFLPSMANGPEETDKILLDDTDVDGYVVFQMNCWNRVVQSAAATGKPVLYADFKYAGSGGFLVYTAEFLRAAAPNVGFVASSNIEDVTAAVRCFELMKQGGSVGDVVAAIARQRVERTAPASSLTCHPDPVTTLEPEECLRALRESPILAVRDEEARSGGTIMGMPVEFIPFAEVNQAWESADRDEARAIADRWEATASVVSGVSRETLESSAAMYLGMKAVLERHGSRAITVNCLGGFYGGHIHAYPCLGFFELNNEGLIGACECDLRSTSTMMALTTLTQGRPGYISDPVIDTARRQIIYAHCVASNRVFGPAGPVNPYQILTHSEDRQGASVRSIMPLEYMTTTLEFHQDREEILLHQGKAVANDPDDRACRTKLAVEPIGDIEKLFTMWDRWGWHRVTIYGDLKEPLYALAEAMDWTVVEEA